MILTRRELRNYELVLQTKNTSALRLRKSRKPEPKLRNRENRNPNSRISKRRTPKSRKPEPNLGSVVFLRSSPPWQPLMQKPSVKSLWDPPCAAVLLPPSSHDRRAPTDGNRIPPRAVFSSSVLSPQDDFVATRAFRKSKKMILGY